MSNLPPVHTPLHNFHYVESTVTREVPKDIGQIMTQSLHMGNYYWKKKRFFSPKQCLSLPIIFLPFCPLKKKSPCTRKNKDIFKIPFGTPDKQSNPGEFLLSFGKQDALVNSIHLAYWNFGSKICLLLRNKIPFAIRQYTLGRCQVYK